MLALVARLSPGDARAEVRRPHRRSAARALGAAVEPLADRARSAHGRRRAPLVPLLARRARSRTRVTKATATSTTSTTRMSSRGVRRTGARSARTRARCVATFDSLDDVGAGQTKGARHLVALDARAHDRGVRPPQRPRRPPPRSHRRHHRRLTRAVTTHTAWLRRIVVHMSPVSAWGDQTRERLPRRPERRHGPRCMPARWAERREASTHMLMLFDAPAGAARPRRARPRSPTARRRSRRPARPSGCRRPLRPASAPPDHSGVLPCLRAGSCSRFVRSIASARASMRRVSRGSITSST